MKRRRSKSEVTDSRRVLQFYTKKQLFQKREAWSDGRSSQKTGIVIEKIVSQRFRYPSLYCFLMDWDECAYAGGWALFLRLHNVSRDP